MRMVLPMLAAFMLAGCAAKPMIWDKSGGTQAAFDTDQSACQFEVMKSTQTRDPGMRTVVGQELELGQRRRELMQYCMRSKGYTLRQ